MVMNELPRWFSGQLFLFVAMISTTTINLYIVDYVRFGVKRKPPRASSSGLANSSRRSRWFSWKGRVASSVKPSGARGARGARDSSDSEEERWGDDFDANASDPWVGDRSTPRRAHPPTTPCGHRTQSHPGSSIRDSAARHGTQ